MNKDELRAVLAHEIGHVANGDMVTLALIQGVVNAFVMFFARVVGDFIDRNVFGREDGEAPGWLTLQLRLYWILYLVFLPLQLSCGSHVTVNIGPMKRVHSLPENRL